MRKARRILVVMLASLICIAIQKGLGVFNAVAIAIDAIAVIILAIAELKRK